MPDLLSELFHRYMNGTASSEEEEALHQALQLQQDEDLLRLLKEEWNSLGEAAPQFREYDVEQSWRLIVQPVPDLPVSRSPLFIREIRRWWWAAASVMLFGMMIAYFSINRNSTPAAPSPNAAAIGPGRDGAMLTLADGTQVLLDSIRDGIVALQGGATAKIVDGMLLYEGKAGETVYNTMSTPRGRQFQLKLPDGSKAWLNAASSLRYPVAFRGKDRRVEVTGEVYFEVEKKATQPFVVMIGNGTEVEVLGTRFNIHAYSNDAALSATLLQGSIRVNREETNNRSSIVLQPGQQASIHALENGIRLTGKVELDKVMAWKNGLFNFNGVRLEEVMKQLERWYDIDVVYENGIPDLHLGGELGRDLSLAEVLEGLRESQLHYRLEEGRRLVVLP